MKLLQDLVPGCNKVSLLAEERSYWQTELSVSVSLARITSDDEVAFLVLHFIRSQGRR
jgi:hypothetical protein